MDTIGMKAAHALFIKNLERFKTAKRNERHVVSPSDIILIHTLDVLESRIRELEFKINEK